MQMLRNAMDEHIRIHGKAPAYIILGYGTYCNVCIYLSKIRLESGIAWLTNFEGASIVIDPDVEHRASSVLGNNPQEAAAQAYIKQRGLGNV
jgi:hypothetical protein